jgi:hypothetical protein
VEQRWVELAQQLLELQEFSVAGNWQLLELDLLAVVSS